MATERAQAWQRANVAARDLCASLNWTNQKIEESAEQLIEMLRRAREMEPKEGK